MTSKDAVRKFLLAILLSLPGGPAASQAMSVHDAFAWVSPGGRSAAAYFRLENHCETGQVVRAASSAVAAQTMLHGHSLNEAGIARMTAVEEGVPVPAGVSVSFKPGGFHVMLMGLQGKPTVGDTIALTLALANGREIEVLATVQPRGQHAPGD